MPDLPSLGESMRMAMRLESTIYAQVQTAPGGMMLAMTIVLLASASEALGQSLVLFLNRVRPRRFVAAIAISTLSNAVGYLLWVTSVWVVARWAFGANQPFWGVASAVGLAYAPQVLAFFELMPYLGNFFGLVLSLWSMLAIVVAVHVGTGLPTWEAALTSLLGWVLIQVWRRSLGMPIYALGRFLQTRAAGSPLHLSVDDIQRLRARRDQLVQNWRALFQQRRPRLIRPGSRTGGSAQLEQTAPDSRPGEEETPHA